MTDDEIFQGLQPNLFGLAYRMLGTVTDAEDVVHEAYLRWRARPGPTCVRPKVSS